MKSKKRIAYPGTAGKKERQRQEALASFLAAIAAILTAHSSCDGAYYLGMNARYAR